MKSDEEIVYSVKYVLEGHPEAAGLTLEDGWAPVGEVVSHLNAKWKTDELTREHLLKAVEGTEVVVTGDRVGLAPPGSIKAAAPDTLYYGADVTKDGPVMSHGVPAGAKLFRDFGDARDEGSKSGRPLVFRVKAYELKAAGYDFHKAGPKAWTTKAFGPEHLA